MADHKLTKSLDLFDFIESLGTALGYVSAREQPVTTDSLQDNDIKWFLDDSQTCALFLFEIETSATNAAHNNAVKVFAKDTSLLPKPLFFFHVFINAGHDTERLPDLLGLFGKLNYNVYPLFRTGLVPLLKDILTQHRRVKSIIDICTVIESLSTSTHRIEVNEMDQLLEHVSRLGFSTTEGSLLATYGLLAASVRTGIRHYNSEMRRMTAKDGGFTQHFFADYGNYISDWYQQPINILLRSLATNEAPDGNELLQWNTRPYGMKLIAAPTGDDREYDAFLIGFAPLLVAFWAAIGKHSVSWRLACVDLLRGMLVKMDDWNYSVRFPTAFWLLHVACLSDSEEPAFEMARASLNRDGGVPSGSLFTPLPAFHIDEDESTISTIDHSRREPIPTWAELREMSHQYSSAVAYDDMTAWGLQILCFEQPILELHEDIVRLLYRRP